MCSWWLGLLFRSGNEWKSGTEQNSINVAPSRCSSFPAVEFSKELPKLFKNIKTQLFGLVMAAICL